MSETYHCARCGSKDIYYYPAVNPNDKITVPLIEEIMMYAECACNECGHDHCVDHDGWLDICEQRKERVAEATTSLLEMAVRSDPDPRIIEDGKQHEDNNTRKPTHHTTKQKTQRKQPCSDSENLQI